MWLCELFVSLLIKNVDLDHIHRGAIIQKFLYTNSVITNRFKRSVFEAKFQISFFILQFSAPHRYQKTLSLC